MFIYCSVFLAEKIKLVKQCFPDIFQRIGNTCGIDCIPCLCFAVKSFDVKIKNIIYFGNFCPFSTTKIKPYIIVVPWLNTSVPKTFKIVFYLLLAINREFSCLNRK